jgi:pyridoxal phosphate phosphatase PHOSPHO2
LNKRISETKMALQKIKSNPNIKAKLAVFDFDNTIINANSDTYIDKLVIEKLSQSDQDVKKSFKYPSEIEELYNKFNWTHRMNGVFEYMKRNHDITKNDMINCLKEIKLNDSMVALLKALKDYEYELVVLSDANTIFIEEILKNHDLHTDFSKIYTNFGEFNETEQLIVKPFNETFNPNGELFDCSTKICASNICKGAVLRAHLNSLHEKEINQNEMSLIYVGDGHNDYCPGLCLKENDFYFVRDNFSLARLLRREKELSDKLKSQILYWNDAADILKHLLD